MDDQTLTPTTNDEQYNEPANNAEAGNSDAVEATAILSMVENAQRSLDAIKQLISVPGVSINPLVKSKPTPFINTVDQEGARVVEGTFDGQNMLGPDGKQYSVPANYASKSKLVEGDILKLIITKDGSFIFKQIGPIDRQRLIGKLIRDEVSGEYRVAVEDRNYKVLLASITYFKGEAGDDVVILVPSNSETRWAAVENIIKHGVAGPEIAV